MALPTDCLAYVLNLARAPQRLAAMQARLAALDIAFTRIEGVDGARLAPEQLVALTRRHRYYKPLRAGEVGCYLGHVQALRAFLATPATFLLLLEDGHCLRDQALDVCRLAGAQEKTGFRATSLETLRQMVAAGVGVTLLPALSVHAPVVQPAGIRLVPFADPAPTRRLALAWRKSSALDGFLRQVADVIGARARAQLG